MSMYPINVSWLFMQPLTSRIEGMPIVDEHALLDDNKYIADVMADFRIGKVCFDPLWPIRQL